MTRAEKIRQLSESNAAIASVEMARRDARALLPLLRVHSVQRIRADIGQERPDVLREFDLLFARLPRRKSRATRLRQTVRRRDISDFLKKLIVERVEAGASKADLQLEFPGLTPSAIAFARRQVGCRIPRGGRRKLSPEQIEQATEMLKHGRAWRDVAPLFGVTTKTLTVNLSFRKFKKGQS